MPLLKKFSRESIRAIGRNPNIDLQSLGFYSSSDIQHHIRKPQFQEIFTRIDKIQDNQSIKTSQNSLKQQVFQTSTDKTTVDVIKT